MRNFILGTLLLLTALPCCAQDYDAVNAILVEGKRLYRSEMASWNGTDIFLEKYKGDQKTGGYFSYADGDVTKCIFYTAGDQAKVMGTISFDSTSNVNTATTDLTEREFTTTEKDLYTIRTRTLEIVNDDKLFKTYENTNYNLIPLISKNEKKVYILTGPKNNGVVIFGNDYLLTFDDANNLVSKRKLHHDAHFLPTQDKDGKAISASIHSHLPETGDYITATDICTLMLYEKFTTWDKHIVVSPKYMSFWDCKANTLNVESTAKTRKIMKDNEKRSKKDKDE